MLQSKTKHTHTQNTYTHIYTHTHTQGIQSNSTKYWNQETAAHKFEIFAENITFSFEFDCAGKANCE